MPLNETDEERILRQALARRAGRLANNSERDQWIAIFGLSFAIFLLALSDVLFR